MDEKPKWPKREKLVEALEIVRNFRESCKLQLELGYPFKVVFPSKIHLNRILSIQYMDREDVFQFYGNKLASELYTYIPHIKTYLRFIQQDTKEENSTVPEKAKSA